MKQLSVLNYYRLALACLLVGLCLGGRLPTPLGSFDLALFEHVSGFYLMACILAALALHWRRPAIAHQVPIHVMVDILAITLLMHASGGIRSGLGMLLITSIAGGSLLMEGRTARLFAALATMAILTEQVYAELQGGPATDYGQAGLLGASFFATAILAHTLAQRLRDSRALAERRGLDLADMAQLTEYIIQRMQTGILMLDDRPAVRLVNESARRLLNLPAASEQRLLDELCPALGARLRDWWDNAAQEPSALRVSDTGAEVMPRFARLGSDHRAGTLVFLEDMTAMAQQAQQLKLASLGRLAAGIAHEVRNPLGAISHASQLLAESPALDPATNRGDYRLVEIIQEHCARVNDIIENILQLGRGSRAQPEEMALRPWLEKFITEFASSERLPPPRIGFEVEPPELSVHADPSQLRQIVWNLCHNGLRHGGSTLQLRAGINAEQPWLDVIDDGPGVAPELLTQIFEPFFTSSAQGTGMGLYIARELCASNQARLHYIAGSAGGCFRIVFADIRRRQVA
ncbi:MAG: ATPase [Chromatiales bacterium]|nr:ATPase [Chromatiales bacterium]